MAVIGYIKKNWKIILLCMAFGVLGILFALANAEAYHATADAEFCIKCHAMEPLVASYKEDVHGGKNEHGVRAGCCDCHLPHDSATRYVIAKNVTSLKDIWGNFVIGPENIDWEEKRNHRERFTYDSGCMGCHHELEEASMGNKQAFLPHRDYFRGSTNETCVSCHPNVGHKDLGLHLKKEE